MRACRRDRCHDRGAGRLCSAGRLAGNQQRDEIGSLRQEADSGNANAQFDLGVRYATGKGVAHDDDEAARWIRKAAEQGHVSAEFSLGVMYADGNGVPQDSALALLWLRKAADQETLGHNPTWA